MKEQMEGPIEMIQFSIHPSSQPASQPVSQPASQPANQPTKNRKKESTTTEIRNLLNN